MRRVLGVWIALALLLASTAVSGHADFWGSLTRIFGRPSSDTATAAPGSDAAAARDSGSIAVLVRAISGFSEEEEIAIGREVSGRVLGAAPLVADPELQRRVNEVGRWVALQGERPDLPWRFGIIASEDINAFAAPGGAILLTSGLYRTLRNESELAGVLAHEIAHVIARHHLKLLQQGTLLEAGSRALSGQSGVGENLGRWIGTGAELFARGLDRNAEHEADRMAVVLAARAGYEPFGLPAVLEEIGHSSSTDARTALLFRTHPLPGERLSALGDAIGDRLDRVEGSTGQLPLPVLAAVPAP